MFLFVDDDKMSLPALRVVGVAGGTECGAEGQHTGVCARPGSRAEAGVRPAVKARRL